MVCGLVLYSSLIVLSLHFESHFRFLVHGLLADMENNGLEEVIKERGGFSIYSIAVTNAYFVNYMT